MSALYHRNPTPQAKHKRHKPFPPAKPGYKYCLDCEQEKSHNEFHKMKDVSDGYRPICKECRKQRDKQPIVIVQKTLFVFSKECTACHKEKDIEEFNKMGSTRDGYHVNCRECQSEYNHQHRIDNLEDYLNRSHIQNCKPQTKVRRSKRHRERFDTDPLYVERKRESRRRSYRNNPIGAKKDYLRRKGIILDTTIEKVDYHLILERDGSICYICGKPIDQTARYPEPESLVFDHCIPLRPRHGGPRGTHTYDNIHPAHRICNSRKSDKPLYLLTDYDRKGP